MFNVTLKFIGGNLEGLTITVKWAHEPKVGSFGGGHGQGSPYQVLYVERI